MMTQMLVHYSYQPVYPDLSRIESCRKVGRAKDRSMLRQVPCTNIEVLVQVLAVELVAGPVFGRPLLVTVNCHKYGYNQGRYRKSRRKGTYIYHIVQRTMLRNGNQDRLMVRSRVNRSETIDTGRQAIVDNSGDDPILLGGVDTFEESEHTGVKRRGLVYRGKLLDDDMCMSDDITPRIHLLRCRVVVRLCIDERPSL